MYQVFHQLVGDFSPGFREDQTDRYLPLPFQKLFEDPLILLSQHLHLLLITLQFVGQLGLPIHYLVYLHLVIAQLFLVYLFHLIHGLSTIHGCDSLLSLTNDHSLWYNNYGGLDPDYSFFFSREKDAWKLYEKLLMQERENPLTFFKFRKTQISSSLFLRFKSFFSFCNSFNLMIIASRSVTWRRRRRKKEKRETTEGVMREISLLFTCSPFTMCTDRTAIMCKYQRIKGRRRNGEKPGGGGGRAV